MTDAESGIARAVREAGGQVALASRLRVTQAAVWRWLKRGRVPPERAQAVSAVTGISLYDLNPKVYPAPERETNVRD